MNCIVVDDDLVSVQVLVELIKRTKFLKLVDTFDDPIKAGGMLVKGGVDVVFLDIEMPEMSGFDLIKTLDKKPQIILVSSKENYALDAFELQVTDYLLKPVVDYTRFLKAVLKAKENIEDKLTKLPESVFLKVSSLLKKFSLSEISYVEAYGDYVKVCAAGKMYTIYATLKSVENKLPKEDFIRVHRSFIVRLDQINNIDANHLSVADKIIPISNTYRSLLMERINVL